MGLLQYHPIGESPCSKNRLFSQFHSQYPEYERERIVKELVEGTSKLRLLFVTVAFGIGVDVPNIRRVIHIGVPYTLEEYFQEAGRCGRDGLPATATIYYNSYDLSKSRKGMTSHMREYVEANECKREFILSYFGYSCPLELIQLIFVVIIINKFVHVMTVCFNQLHSCSAPMNPPSPQVLQILYLPLENVFPLLGMKKLMS
jgi:hypothetical protein